MTMTLNRPRSTKATRRTEADMWRVRRAITEVLEDEHPLTARQVFYRLVVRGDIEKTEGEYKQTVIRLLTDMRMASITPAALDGFPVNCTQFDWIIDESRGIHETQTFDSTNEALTHAANFYRRNALRELSSDYIEIWIEKEGLAGIVWKVASEYDVPVIPTKGFQSVTKLHEALERISAAYDAGAQSCVFYQFGDHDPSGVFIPEAIENRMAEFCQRYDCPLPEIVRVALTKEQIERYGLPSRPTKKEGNNHAKNFDGDSTEIEALTSNVLRDMVRECIEGHIDPEQVAELRAEEDTERQNLIDIAGRAA
jgi:hypothetical protein